MNPFRLCNRYSFGIVLLLILSTEARAFNDPVTGRWITRDPIEYVDGMNIYECVTSNPIRHSDPSGRVIPIVVGGIATIGIADAVAATFGLSLIACMASPPCAQAVRDALQEAGRKAVEKTRDAAGRAKEKAKETFKDIKDWAYRKFGKFGRCTQPQHAVLEAAKNLACYPAGGFSCDGITNCDILRANLMKAGACQAARNAINNICYGGGDSGHQTAADTAGKAAAKCMGAMIANGCFNKTRGIKNPPKPIMPSSAGPPPAPRGCP